MHLIVAKLEKEGSLYDTKIIVGDLQKIFDMILEYFIKTDGCFPTYEQVCGSLEKEKIRLFSEPEILVPYLIQNRIIGNGEKNIRQFSESSVMKINFESVFISKTETEMEETSKLIGSYGEVEFEQPVIQLVD